MLNKFRILTLKGIVIASLFSFSVYSQGTITINPRTQRFVNNESTFNRDKYFNIHQLTDLKDADFIQFKNRFDMKPSYRGARILDSPLKNHNKTGNFPQVRRNFSGVRQVENRFASTNPKEFFYKKNADYSKENMTQYIDKLTNYMRDYYRYQEPLVPKYIEPLNEPVIVNNLFVPGGNGLRDRLEVVNTRIFELHRELGKKIHAAPELRNMKVTGFAMAFPAFEAGNFRNWNSTYKRFIDIAGKDVDIFSVHVYDGVGVNNFGGRRSGSNLEAVLDMIETYSSIKLGKVKPIAVTEYGRLMTDQPGFSPGNGVSNYNPLENAQAVRSQMHMSLALMERGEDIEYSIPFTMNKQPPTTTFVKAALWNRVSRNPLRWEYTPRLNFFELWRGVKGKRIEINSTNIDVQTQAFLDNNKLYVVLNNLNDITQTVNLNLVNGANLTSVNVRRLKVFEKKLPEITEVTRTTAPDQFSLVYGESAVITYTFAAPKTFNKKATSTKYYSNKYLQPIRANTANTFTFNNVKTGKGKAKLRLAVGRNLKSSFRPKVAINGTNVVLPKDIIRGDNQSKRREFFGTLEIPFNINLLKAGANNVSVSFPDNLGHISSVILEIETIENVDSNTNVDSIALASFTIPMVSADQYTFDVTYEASEQRDIVVAILEGNTVFKGSGKITVARGSGNKKVTITLPTALPPGKNYIVRAMIREKDGDFSTNKDLSQVTDVEVISNTLSTIDFNLDKENTFYVYPNPVTNELNISLEGRWSISSVSGRKVLQGDQQTVDVTALSKGIYFLKLDTNVVKFIKE
ncbi:T9SS type A sorting domain-containing protein [Aquimarina sp. ERC-38]|uniref:T9SS type A sorting domain-containing protein n=1 Tax=Aquimarina sp. ERC-38 TaxID=2949996 RepID=UPI0022469354|nr:T9SS type A sorting domain-containing protein [Aquimarina sp. ERC-38]UZO79460.1 T9SS type A sorting domain-containing protein [Aquimarina sp. ERC-38]